MLVVALTFALLILTLAFVAARRRRFLLPDVQENQFDTRLPVKTASLFAPDEHALHEIERQKRQRDLQEERGRTLAWASLIDFADLPEVKNIADEKLRRDALEILTERADTDEDVRALVRFVSANDETCASKQLINRFQKIWRQAPDRPATTQMFLLAAESSDADLFLDVLTLAEQFAAAGKLHDLTLNELHELANSHYWLLAEPARISGAGFLIKQKLMFLHN